MRLTRVYRFSASHRLHSDRLTAEENGKLYGKCNNPYGHGHNYVLHISIAGTPDPGTGRIVSPRMLDEYVARQVLDVFDHRDMNEDVPDFRGVPTTENLAADIYRRLGAGWIEHFETVTLERVRIQETPRNSFELRTR